MSCSAKLVVLSSSVLLAASVFLIPSPAQIQNPIKAAKDAYNKARQDAQQKQQQQRPQATPTATAPPAGTQPASRPAAAAPQDSTEPWTPPADDTPAAVAVDFSKMPDVVGVRVGMAPQEALQILRKVYPSDRFVEMPVTWWPAPGKVDYGYNVNAPDSLGTPDAYLSFTAPPNPQVVWRITRFTHRMHINRVTLLAALREKYGKETVALSGNGSPVTGDRLIGNMFWLFNEQGGRVPLPPPAAFPQNGTIWDCMYDMNSMANPQPIMPAKEEEVTQRKGYCTSFVGVHIQLDDQEIVENTFTEMQDNALAMRMAKASAAWQRDLAEKQRRDDLEKSKSVKPVF